MRARVTAREVRLNLCRAELVDPVHRLYWTIDFSAHPPIDKTLFAVHFSNSVHEFDPPITVDAQPLCQVWIRQIVAGASLMLVASVG